MRTPLLVAAAVLGLAGVAIPRAALADDPVDTSKRAAEQLEFRGVVEVQWADGTGVRRDRLDVRGAGGVLSVGGDSAVPLLAHADERYVAGPGVGWNLVWAGTPRTAPPNMASKYDLAYRVGPMIVGRPTELVLVTRSGRVQERVYVDRATGLILRREQLDGRQRLHRVVAFETLSIGEPKALSSPSRASAGGAVPRPASRDHGPGTLASGYRRVGTWRKGAVTQSLYSDGVYELSVFEQQGRLDRRRPKGADAVAVGSHRGWHVAWPGGEVVVWQSGGRVFTAVGEGPVADVLAAARSVPTPRTTIVERFRRGCWKLFAAFG